MFTGEEPTKEEANEFADFLKAELVSSQVLKAGENREEYFRPCRDFGNLFLDPDTGVRLDRKRSEKHIFGEELVKIVRARPKALTLIFDQSYSRADERASAIEEKLEFFAGQNVYGFAYDSHATFLLLCHDLKLLEHAHIVLLENSHLPRKRIIHKQC